MRCEASRSSFNRFRGTNHKISFEFVGHRPGEHGILVLSAPTESKGNEHLVTDFPGPNWFWLHAPFYVLFARFETDVKGLSTDTEPG